MKLNETFIFVLAVNSSSQSPPVIQASPSSMDINLTNPVNFTCNAEGSPEPSYQWYKDGEPIPGMTREYLYIEEVRPEHRGNYTCVAINVGGRVESEPARLKILGNQFLSILE